MKHHSPAFLKLIHDSKQHIKEVSTEETLSAMETDPQVALIDVREESEYAAGHVKGSEHLGKGIIERDIEKKHPDMAQPLYLYCGGGFRSVLVADNLQKMGYTNVFSVAGGWGAFKEMNVDIEKGK
ncbi:sulfurtransferase [bacterium]|nr:MAG: sulfurtransferase [bacterium]